MSWRLWCRSGEDGQRSMRSGCGDVFCQLSSDHGSIRAIYCEDVWALSRSLRTGTRSKSEMLQIGKPARIPLHQFLRTIGAGNVAGVGDWGNAVHNVL